MYIEGILKSPCIFQGLLLLKTGVWNIYKLSNIYAKKNKDSIYIFELIKSPCIFFKYSNHLYILGLFKPPVYPWTIQVTLYIQGLLKTSCTFHDYWSHLHIPTLSFVFLSLTFSLHLYLKLFFYTCCYFKYFRFDIATILISHIVARSASFYHLVLPCKMSAQFLKLPCIYQIYCHNFYFANQTALTFCSFPFLNI